ncbi:MAG: two-component system sensor histidine kinase ChiS [Phenylobacterium sp.]
MRSIMQDRTGILWFGTYANGANKFNSATGHFVHYRHNSHNQNSLKSNYVSAIHADSAGIVWVATEEAGLTRVKLSPAAPAEFKHYRHQPQNPRSISDDYVMSIYEDHSKQLWLGTANQGLNRFNRQTQTFTNFLHEPQNPASLSSNRRLRTITEDADFNLWVGTNKGLNRLSPDRSTFTRYNHVADDPTSIGSDIIQLIFEDRQQRLWVALYGIGLERFDRASETFIHYRHDPNNPNSLSSNAVYSIYQSEDDILWIGTDAGLNRYDPVAKTFRHYRRQQGLSNDTVLGVVGDNAGFLWITTNDGLNRFDPRTEVFDVFKFSDGLQDNEYSTGATFVSPSGQIMVGGINGFNVFEPQDIVDDKIAPATVFTGFLLNNQEVDLKKKGSVLVVDINQTAEMVLSHIDSVVTFEFAALHFASPKQNQYRYQLLGFDQQWVKTDAANRRATYTNLDPGNYQLRVKTSNGDDQWSQQRAVKITILPPPWRTWWAYTLYTVLVSAIVSVIVYLRFKKLAAEHQAQMLKAKQQQLVEGEKMAALGNLVAGVAHEVNTPLGICITMVSLHLDKLQQTQQELAAGTLTRKLMINYFEQTQESQALVQGNLHRAADLVSSFKKVSVEQTADVFEQLVFHDYLRDTLNNINSIQPRIADEQITLTLLSRGDWRLKTWPGAWWQILSNLVDNSISHGFLQQTVGEITISAEIDQNHLRLIYRDNGLGMSKDELEKIYEPFYTTARNRGGTGLGMHIVFNQVVQKLGGCISCRSELGEGITFTIEVPL